MAPHVAVVRNTRIVVASNASKPIEKALLKITIYDRKCLKKHFRYVLDTFS